MILLIGLGNIGTHFDGTRHNVGFAMLDAFATAHSLTWQTKDKFKAVIAEGVVSDQKIILAKPTTYYNLAGEAARAIKDFYKLENTAIAVVHDELALPFGTVRTRLGGSNAGNNGIKSITAHCGADTVRIRVGIANDLLTERDAADFVLARFSTQEIEQWPLIQKQTIQQLSTFIDPSKKFEHTSVRI